jgi:hypothetical protein
MVFCRRRDSAAGDQNRAFAAWRAGIFGETGPDFRPGSAKEAR